MTNALTEFQARNTTSIVGKHPTTHEEVVMLANAISAPTGRLKTLVNMEVEIVNYYMEHGVVTNEDGEANDVVATTLMMADGGAYSTVSSGVAKAIQTVVNLAGPPDEWPQPLRAKVVERQVGRGSMLTLEFI